MGQLSRTARVAVAGAMLLGAVAGCDGDDAIEPIGAVVTAPRPPDGTPLPSSATLRAELLTARDLPTGFAALDIGTGGPDDPGSSTQDESAQGKSALDTSALDKSRTDPTECALVLASIATQQPGAVGDAAVHYGGPDLTSIDIDAASYPIDRVAAAFTSLQRLLHRCERYTGTDADGIDVDYRIGRGSQPGAGDASVNVRIVTRSQGLELTSDVLIAAVGPTLVQFAASGQQPVDARLLTDLVSAQVRRLRGPAGP